MKFHVISAWCVARDLHTTAPRPLQGTCWRQVAAQWGDCKKSQIAPFSVINIIILITIAGQYIHLCHQSDQKKNILILHDIATLYHISKNIVFTNNFHTISLILPCFPTYKQVTYCKHCSFILPVGSCLTPSQYINRYIKLDFSYYHNCYQHLIIQTGNHTLQGIIISSELTQVHQI